MLLQAIRCQEGWLTVRAKRRDQVETDVFKRKYSVEADYFRPKFKGQGRSEEEEKGGPSVAEPAEAEPAEA